MKKPLLCIFFMMLGCVLQAQELFPHNEPASSIPKGVLGVRVFADAFKEVNIWRNMEALRLMYGLSPKLSVMATLTASNHHGSKLPSDLISHTHTGTQTTYYTNSIQKGNSYRTRINGVYLFAKYRLLTYDSQNRHLRAALYADGSFLKTPHDEAEPTLLDDTKGYGGGFILTLLNKRFAASFTGGFILPAAYSEVQVEPGLSGPPPTIKIQYGRALRYNLSLGYLLYPKKYENYAQTNWNIYLEFMGKSYEAAQVLQNDNQLAIQSPALRNGNYLELHPGIQKIIASNLRIDFSVGFPLVNKSWVRFYPVYMLAVQRYFYFKSKSKTAT